MLARIVNFFTSLRLTVVCLSLALGLVFIGTLAQVKLGLYIVQDSYFNSWFVWHQFAGSKLKIPVWPGGLLIGSVLLINLVAAHLKRFELSKKKIGIFTIHAGLILLLVGQLVTQFFQVETYMAIPEGERRNYSESGRFSELAVIDVTDTNSDFVVSIPEEVLAKQKEISHASLPFKIRVNSYYINSEPSVTSPKGEGDPGELVFLPKPQAIALDDQNIPAATVEVLTDSGVHGPFRLARWLTERQVRFFLGNWLEKNHGSMEFPGLSEPITFSHQGRQYEIALRPRRHYKPFYIQLLDFTHERYRGTEIPKNFSSRVRLVRPETEEDREVLIYMNNPLRYWGETYYQGSFEPGDTVTILQVVRNPSWLTPYLACTLVTVGLLIQFLYHLVGFARKKRT